MMARVRLDASHVSRSVTARREKTTRYIRVLNKLSEVRMFSSVGKRWFLVKLWFSLKVYGVLEFSCAVSRSFLRLIADSIVVEVLFAAFWDSLSS